MIQIKKIICLKLNTEKDDIDIDCAMMIVFLFIGLILLTIRNN